MKLNSYQFSLIKRAQSNEGETKFDLELYLFEIWPATNVDSY
jgi:hypothetical protein